MSGALGLDLDVAKLSPQERKQIADGVALYKAELRDLISQGDLYRLESPYAGPRAVLEIVAPDRSHAVLFVYRLKAGSSQPVRLEGLDSTKKYRVREINLPQGGVSGLAADGKVLNEATLASGLTVPTGREYTSTVIELTAE
jgi:alpha-galactosidase